MSGLAPEPEKQEISPSWLNYWQICGNIQFYERQKSKVQFDSGAGGTVNMPPSRPLMWWMK